MRVCVYMCGYMCVCDGARPCLQTEVRVGVGEGHGPGPCGCDALARECVKGGGDPTSSRGCARPPIPGACEPRARTPPLRSA